MMMLTWSAVAQADSSVTVMLNDEGMKVASRLNVSIPELIQRAHDKIEELYKLARLDSLLNAFADTGAFAQRSVGVDYDVDPGQILVGVAAIGVHADVAIGTTDSGGILGGSIANLTVMSGVNLGRWQHPRWTLFASGFYEATTIRALTGHLLTLATHVQYQLVPPVRHRELRWTGVAVTTGLEYSNWTVGEAMDTPIESHFTAVGNEGGVVEKYTINMFSTGTLDVTSNTITVPLEVTTGGRVGPLALYGGFGVDVTAGSSKIVAALDSPLTYLDAHVPIGSVVIVGSGENGPSALTAHGLLGFAVHTRHVRVFAQTAIAPGETAIAIGTRGAF